MPNEPKVIRIVGKYCWKIRRRRGHYVCYPKNSDKVIIISASPSDINFSRNVFHDFRRVGIIINELKSV